jgi:hypothetical protein
MHASYHDVRSGKCIKIAGVREKNGAPLRCIPRRLRSPTNREAAAAKGRGTTKVLHKVVVLIEWETRAAPPGTEIRLSTYPSGISSASDAHCAIPQTLTIISGSLGIRLESLQGTMASAGNADRDAQTKRVLDGLETIYRSVSLHLPQPADSPLSDVPHGDEALPPDAKRPARPGSLPGQASRPSPPLQPRKRSPVGVLMKTRILNNLNKMDLVEPETSWAYGRGERRPCFVSTRVSLLAGLVSHSLHLAGASDRAREADPVAHQPAPRDDRPAGSKGPTGLDLTGASQKELVVTSSRRLPSQLALSPK